MKLIDKDAVIAEIERLIERANAERVLHPKTILAAKNYLLIEDYNKLLSFINTLDVKEVNLEEEIESSMNNLCEPGCYIQLLLENPGDYENFDKHFFELGLKTTKENTYAILYNNRTK